MSAVSRPLGVMMKSQRIDDLVSAMQRRQAVRLMADHLRRLPDHPNKPFWLSYLRREYAKHTAQIETLTGLLYREGC